MGQLGPGVLTKRNTEEGGRLTDSLPMSTQRQPSNPRLRLGLLGWLFVDIGMKLHSVLCSPILLKLGCASALENFTVKCTSCNCISSQAKSNQAGLSPISSQPRLATLDLADLRLDLGQLGWTEPDYYLKHLNIPSVHPSSTLYLKLSPSDHIWVSL